MSGSRALPAAPYVMLVSTFVKSVPHSFPNVRRSALRLRSLDQPRRCALVSGQSLVVSASSCRGGPPATNLRHPRDSHSDGVHTLGDENGTQRDRDASTHR